MSFHIGIWDLGLVIVVSLQATLLAYLARPQWKAALLTLPIPFTVATLAVGQRPGIMHVLGLVLLFSYTQAVRVLHTRLGLPIIFSILVAAVGYCVVAGLLAPWLPRGETAFWLASLAVLALAIALFRAMPERAEPDYRSALPVWLKLPIIAAITLALVILKGWLQGFVALFPMVGLVAAYEARHSLWTIGRQIPVLMVSMVPLIVSSHLAQPVVGLGLALVVGWVAFLVVFLPIAWRMRPRLEPSPLVPAETNSPDLEAARPLPSDVA
jgi:hypothetical protein